MQERDPEMPADEMTRPPTNSAPDLAADGADIHSLRLLVTQVLRSDSDLDAFCQDHFHEVYQRFTDGMDRVRKVTILLAHADPGTLLQRLRDAQAAAALRVERRKRRASAILVAAPAAVVAALIAGWLFRPTEPLPHPPSPDTAVPLIAPFDSTELGVVLGGPWLKGEKGQELFQALYDLDAQHAVRRVPFSSSTSFDDFHQKARAAGAVLIIEIHENGMAQVHPQGRLERSALFRGPISVDLSRDADRGRAAVVINALARSSGPNADLQLDTVRCPDLPAESLDRIALLTLLVLPSCQSKVIDSRRFQDVCRSSPSDANDSCALALYLDAEHNPSTARSNLEALSSNGPKRFQTEAKLKLADLDCKQGAAGKAAEAVRELFKSSDACLRVQLPEIAACIVANPGSRSVTPSIDAGGGQAATIEEIEGMQIDPQQKCPKRQRARAMARRGYWRARRGHWEAATLDYQEAFDLARDPSDALALAEAWLQQKRPIDAGAVLDGLHALKSRDQEVKAALLRWIAAREANAPSERAAAEAALVKLHGEPIGTPALEGPEEPDLRGLACRAFTSLAGGRARSPDCIYDILRRFSSIEELKKSFSER
jgi:tetratricopeptide (TPR) repeat protein